MADANEQSEKFNELAREKDIVDVTDVVGGDRPLIKIPSDQRELIDFCRECAKELAKNGRLFRRDRTPVIVNHEKARLDAVTPRMMCSLAQRYIRFFKFKTVEGEKDTRVILKNIPAQVAGQLLESLELAIELPEIRRVNPTRLPVVRADGRIELLQPGFFAEQGIFTIDDGIVYDESMTREKAVSMIDDVLKDFPFLNDRSKSVAVAAMPTRFCATMLPRRALRPGFIATANGTGAGKTLIFKLAIYPVVGSCSLRTLPRREEARKVLDSLAIAASPYILFDNVRGKIASEDIEAFITSAEVYGRVLGESSDFRVDNVATIFLTGNQASTSGDMAERCLFVELFIEEVDNRARQISRIIDDDFLADPARRSGLLSALWSLVRAWEADGKPRAPSPLMPRFETWSKLIAGIVYASGFGDPLETPLVQRDAELRDMHELMKVLAPTEGDAMPWTFGEIIEQIQEHGLFDDAEIWQGRQQRDAFDNEGRITNAGKSFFGKMLVGYDQRLFRTSDGQRLRLVVKGKGKTRMYIVERVA
jgi:hypothetical protein